MQEESALIDIVDEKGGSLGHKQRKDVNKLHDILKAVYILVQNNEQKILLTRSKSDPLYPNKWGCSAAGLMRHEESAEEAAKRTLKRELGFNANLEQIESGFYNFSGVKRWMWMFRAKAAAVRQTTKDSDECAWFSLAEIEAIIRKGDAMPMLEPQIKVLNSKNSTLLK